MLNQKAINFDLDTKKLKKFYPKNNITQAYNDIRIFLENRGFKHRQGSGYVSVEKMSMTVVEEIMEDMAKEMSWISVCAKEVDVTNIGRKHSMLATLREQTSMSIDKEINETEIDIDIAEDFTNRKITWRNCQVK